MRIVVLLALAAIGGVLLSGCSGSDGGAAKVDPNTVGDSPKAGEPQGNPAL